MIFRSPACLDLTFVQNNMDLVLPIQGEYLTCCQGTICIGYWNHNHWGVTKNVKCQKRPLAEPGKILQMIKYFLLEPAKCDPSIK